MKKTRLSILGIIVACLPLIAQPVKTPRPAADPLRPSTVELPPSPVAESRNKGILLETSEDYQIGAGDVIEVQIEDAPELSRLYRVTAGGKIQLPRLGLVAALNRTAEELANTVAETLRKQEYLNEPQVTVLVKQYNSQTFFVHGEVRQPGVYQVEGRPSVLKLLSLAGGLTDKHASTLFVLRPARATAQKDSSVSAEAPPQAAAEQKESASTTDDQAVYEVSKVRLRNLLQGEQAINLRVESGTILYIPESEVFFVGGEVMAPGSFPLKEGTTLRQAISLAKGPTNKAAPQQGVIFREDEKSGQRTEIRVDLAQIMKGKQEDVLLRPNDVVLLPSSRSRTITTSLIPAAGSGLAVALGQLPLLLLR